MVMAMAGPTIINSLQRALGGQNQANNFVASKLGPSYGALADNAPAPVAQPEPQFPQINFAALNKVTDPDMQKMVLQWLMNMTMQREEMRVRQQTEQQMNPLQKAQIANLDAETAAIGQPQKAEQLKSATVLRGEYQGSPTYKNYLIVKDSAEKMKVAYDEAVNNPTAETRIASDQALGVLFQKMLDPGSVVRESEYARTSEGASVLSRIKAWIPKLAKGGLGISDADRKALSDMGQKLLTVNEKGMSQHTSGYTKLAKQYSLDPTLVVGTPGETPSYSNMSDEQLLEMLR